MNYGGWRDVFPHLCVNHPDEAATTGIPEQRFIDPHGAVKGYVYFCAPCALTVNKRLAEATRRAVAPLNVMRYLDDDGLAADEALLSRALRAAAVVEGSSSRDDMSHAVSAWEAAHPGENLIAKNPDNYALLTLRDVRTLMELIGLTHQEGAL